MRDMPCAEVVCVKESMGANPDAGQTYEDGVEKKQGTDGVMPKRSFGLRVIVSARL